MTKTRNLMPTRRPWTESELELLRRRYADTPTVHLAEAIGRDVRHVYAAAGRLGLAKSHAFLATSASGRILRGGKLSVEHQFKPGFEPWNKGKPGSTGHHPNTVANQFRKGSKPQTWVPVGSLRVCEGRLERKVNDLPGNTSVRWKPVSRLVWEAAHGPVPAGHVVAFKPGRNTLVEADITLDAVDLLTRAQNMARNTLHNMPKDLAELVQLRGVLNRQINKRLKETA
jgi:hypothetical protein